MTRRRIGIWTEWERPIDWDVEGLTRLVRFIIEGSASRGDLHCAVFVRRHNQQAAWDALSSAAATAGLDWSLIVVPAAYERPGSDQFERTYGALSPSAFVERAYFDILCRKADVGGRKYWLAFLEQGGTRSDLVTAFLHSEEHAATPMAAGLKSTSTSAIAELEPDELHRAEIDGWLILRSDFESGLELPGRRVALFADAVPVDFPLSQPGTWDDGGETARWLEATHRVLADADGVITFSQHVAHRHAIGTFGVAASKVAVIPHAPPDLGPLATWLPPNRRRTPESRRAATAALDSIARRRKWTYLIDFPFDEIDFVAVASRDRPTKNLPVAVRAIDHLIKTEFRNIKLFTTAAVDPLDLDFSLPRVLAETYLYLDAVTMTDLPPREHAAFLHAAAVTVHPSPTEGGTFPFQFAESVSVGTPCLIAQGAHVEELLSDHPSLRPWVFDPYDHRHLARLIVETIEHRDEVVAHQSDVYMQLRERVWADVAQEYGSFVLDGRRTTAPATAREANR